MADPEAFAVGLVTLHDGTPADSASEAWRHECEARYVLAMPTARREKFLTKVAERRGEEPARSLKLKCHEVEPAYVLSLPNKPQRLAYLARVEDDFGEGAANVLRGRILAMHEKRKSFAAKTQDAA